MNINYFLSLLGGLLGFMYQTEPPQKTTTNDTLVELFNLSSKALSSYDYENSIHYSLLLMERAQEEKDYYYLYHAYNNLGITFEDRKDIDRARDNYSRALENAIASKNDTLLWWAYNNLGGVYTLQKETVEKGFSYYDRSIEIVKQLGNPKNSLIPIMNKGWTHLDYEQYDRAYPYLVKANKLLGNSNDDYIRSQLSTLFGRYYAGKGDFERADCFLQASIAIVERDSLVLEASDTYRAYADMLYAKGDFPKAFAALEKYHEFQGKIFEQEKKRQNEAAYTKFETEEYRKNLELAQNEQEFKDKVLAKTREASMVMIISIAIMLLFLILLFRSNSIRKRLIYQLRDKNDELRKSKEEAEKLSLLKTKFLSTVSHELRTPLYGVVGLTSLLLEDNKDQKQVEDLKSLKFSADYLLALINDVLQMNKMESNLVHLENLSFNVQDLMLGIVKSFEFTRIQNNNEIELVIDEKTPQNLIGDSVRLSQIIMNLVGNAVKFTEWGRVWIKAECKRCEGDYCLISFEVGDTGIGIPEDKQKEIFEEFSQLRSNNYNYQGTGLGRPIVKRLLELFNSEIHLESQEGKGSVFSFEILFQKGKITENKAASGEMGDLQMKEIFSKALIVDDNRINQIVTQRILEKRKFHCEIANSGYEAIEKLKTENFDVVLMDVNMPGMDGMETTREIRKFNTDIPVIALTAVEIEEMREGILRSGMNDIIVKPYDTNQFFHTVYRNLLVPISQ